MLLCVLALLRVGAGASTYAALSASTRIDDPHRCLLSSQPCDTGRDCKSFAYNSDCLASTVPSLWAVQSKREIANIRQYQAEVECCFSCCLNFIVHLYSIKNTQYIMNSSLPDAPLYNDYFTVGNELAEYDAIVWADRARLGALTVKPKGRPRPSGTPRQSTPLVTPASLLHLSKQVHAYDVIGKNDIFKIQSILVGTRDKWSRMKGRRSIVLHISAECVSREILALSLKRSADFGNPGVSMLYSQQLPCPDTPRNPKEAAGHLANALFISKRFDVIPMGIRDSISFQRAMNSRFDPGSLSSSPAQLTVDCTCASHFKEGRALIQSLYRKNLNRHRGDSFQCYVNGNLLPEDGAIMAAGADFKGERMWHIDTAQDGSVIVVPRPFYRNEDKLIQYYTDLLNFKYSLSPSSNGFLSPCEWEAIAAGVIPILKFPPDPDSTSPIFNESASKVFHRTIEKLFQDLPMYPIANWELAVLSEKKLNNKYSELQAAFGQQSYSTSRTYIYHWINSFKHHLLTAKPSGRFFSRNHVEEKQIPLPMSIDPVDCAKARNDSLSEGTNKGPLIELVIPRCCEDGVEFSWLVDFVRVMDPRIAVALYYKCPQCLPRTKAKVWIENVIGIDSTLAQRVKRGYILLDDVYFVNPADGRMITQSHAFDSVYNGKEVTAYLKHVIERYDSLARQTVFLHSLPNAHISFNMFYRLLKYNLECREVPFVHLNVKYKFGIWGKCCGFNQTCQKSTWRFLFQDDKVISSTLNERIANHQLDASTYSSAQFAVSRKMLRSHRQIFYYRMLSAINGSHDLEGCDNGFGEGKVLSRLFYTSQCSRKDSNL